MNKTIVSKILVLFLLGSGVFIAADTQRIQAPSCDFAMFQPMGNCDEYFTTSHDVSEHAAYLDDSFDSSCTPSLD